MKTFLKKKQQQLKTNKSEGKGQYSFENETINVRLSIYNVGG